MKNKDLKKKNVFFQSIFLGTEVAAKIFFVQDLIISVLLMVLDNNTNFY
jgi:hypothetical protein